MVRKYLVAIEKDNKKQWFLVDAASELDAIMQARSEAKDVMNNCHVISVSLA